MSHQYQLYDNNDHLPVLTVPPCVTYKIVGDNIDKNVSPK